MKIKSIVDEDFVNYKKPSMFLIFPYCLCFKCEKESGIHCCQNSELARQTSYDVLINDILERYMQNSITSAIVCGGLEPFDSWNDLYELIQQLRAVSTDDIVIYTGYYKKEIQDYVNQLKRYPNIIIKFGRYIPNQPSRYDEVLGVTLASNNQYAEQIS